MSARRCAWTLVVVGALMMLTGFLGGCQTVETRFVDRVVEVRPTVAPSLLRCRPEPDPLPATAKQRDIAPYVIDLVEAGADCRRKLGTVAKRLEPNP